MDRLDMLVEEYERKFKVHDGLVWLREMIGREVESLRHKVRNLYNQNTVANDALAAEDAINSNLRQQLAASKEIQAAEKKILIAEIEKSGKLEEEVERLKEELIIGGAGCRLLKAVQQETENQLADARGALQVISVQPDNHWCKFVAAKALEEQGCQCDECQITPHQSDCAVHNMPALPKRECDCGAVAGL